MDTKEIKIQIPEGYKIDTKNSNFECIKFIPIKKDITYKEVCKEIFNNRGFYITKDGEITKDVLNYCESDKNNAISREQLERILALNQLLNIAEYYNKNSKMTGGFRYEIVYVECGECYDIYCNTVGNDIKYGVEAFFNKKRRC